MGEKRGTKALELWCRRITSGYPGVNVQNMTTSWRDGLAFCAMIHHFRPDLIDFNSLDKNDVYGNNELAFRTAEKHLGIPALLDAEDMASCSVPDRLSILTYLSQFYQTFGGSSPSRLAVNRTTEVVDERIVPISESPKPKVASCLGVRRDQCIACGLPVFLAEKLVVAHVVYHRTCFRCARCNNQLTLGNYYETEEGQFCCETCPDEEATTSAIQKYKSTIFSEMSENPERDDSNTDTSYQESFDNETSTDRRLLNHNSSKSLELDSTIPDLVAQTSRLRLNFISNHLLSEKSDETCTVGGSLTSGDSSAVEKDPTSIETETMERLDSAFPVNDKHDEGKEGEGEYNLSGACVKPESQSEEKATEGAGDFVKTEDYVQDKLSSSVKEEEHKLPINSFRTVVKDKPVNLVTRTNNTKELIGHTDERGDADSCLSLVQKRLKLFEAQDRVEHVGRREIGHKSSEVLESKAQNKEHVELANKGHKDLIVDLEKSEVTVPKSSTINTAEESPVTRNRNCSKSNLKINETTENQALTSNVKDVNVEKSRKDTNTVTVPDVSPSHHWKMAKHSTTVHVDKESNEDKAFVAGAKESNEICAKGADLSISEDYPEDLNPFKSIEEDDDKHETTVDSFESTRDLTNSFDSEEVKGQGQDKEQKAVPPKPATRNNFSNSKPKQQFLMEIQTKRRLAAPQINLNPFWSDEDDHDSDLDCQEDTSKSLPIPKPRTIKHIQEVEINERKLNLSRNSLYASNGSLTSSESGVVLGATSRKKKPAPLPPNIKELSLSDQRSSPVHQLHNNSAEYHDSCPRTTPKTRKTKPAPPPPMPTSTPCNTPIGATLNFEESPIVESSSMNQNENAWEDKKTNKDEANRSKQSLMHVPCGDNFDYKSYADKSTQGKWKRKKGPAPLCPIPHKRKIKVMSLKDVKLELDEIELQQQGLEKQGVRLEQLIRNKCESGPSTDDAFPGTDVEELVLELFALVNEKNELFRRQAELMLLRRQQRLEEEHVEVEYQIRCLMSQHESTKTDFDKQREEALIQRLVEIVERRNEIVECLEMDRRREIEEDKSIHKHMGLFAAKKKNETSSKEMDDPCCSKTKKDKPKKKTKEKKSKRMSKKDIDKDIDETELKLKRSNKRKWF